LNFFYKNLNFFYFITNYQEVNARIS